MDSSQSYILPLKIKSLNLPLSSFRLSTKYLWIIISMPLFLWISTLPKTSTPTSSLIKRQSVMKQHLIKVPLLNPTIFTLLYFSLHSFTSHTFVFALKISTSSSPFFNNFDRYWLNAWNWKFFTCNNQSNSLGFSVLKLTMINYAFIKSS